MGVNGCGAQVLVPQKVLDDPEIYTVLQKMGRKRMTQAMNRGLLWNIALGKRGLEGLLKRTL